MKKSVPSQKVLQMIREAIVGEELAIPLYASHIQQTLFWSGVPKQKQEKIIEGLKILERDSKGHVLLLREVEKIYLHLFT